MHIRRTGFFQASDNFQVRVVLVYQLALLIISKNIYIPKGQLGLYRRNLNWEWAGCYGEIVVRCIVCPKC